MAIDDVDQRLVYDAAVLVLDDRDLQPLGEDVGGHAADRSADVEPVPHAAGEAGEPALVEDRQREGHVIEMAAGGVGVVGDVDVARLHVLDAEMPDLRLQLWKSVCLSSVSSAVYSSQTSSRYLPGEDQSSLVEHQ